MTKMNRQWVVKSQPSGMVQPDNFDWVEAPIPAPRQGEILVCNYYLSFEPAQRG